MSRRGILSGMSLFAIVLLVAAAVLVGATGWSRLSSRLGVAAAP